MRSNEELIIEISKCLMGKTPGNIDNLTTYVQFPRGFSGEGFSRVIEVLHKAPRSKKKHQETTHNTQFDNTNRMNRQNVMAEFDDADICSYKHSEHYIFELLMCGKVESYRLHGPKHGPKTDHSTGT
jgi:uncharacterized protein YecE (DUF72 family)